MNEFLLTGDTGIKLVENDGCSVYQLRNETGEGTITVYEIFSGVTFSYNDSFPPSAVLCTLSLWPLYFSRPPQHGQIHSSLLVIKNIFFRILLRILI